MIHIALNKQILLLMYSVVTVSLLAVLIGNQFTLLVLNRF